MESQIVFTPLQVALFSLFCVAPLSFIGGVLLMAMMVARGLAEESMGRQ